MPMIHLTAEPWLQCRGDGLHLRLLTHGVDPAAARVDVRTLPDNEEHLVPMRPATRDGERIEWHADIPWDGGNETTRYAFRLLTADAQHWLAADGDHRHVPPDELHFRVHPTERPPAWVADQVVYQIFPDRFARGHEPADRRGETLAGSALHPVVQKAWDDPIDFEHAPNSFWGGDLPGITARLDYLQHEVGATTLYLNPVFTAGSNHRYDTEDYFQVDPHLGGNEALAELAGALHGRGMRLVLDAVINHTGTGHPWFNRWGRHETVGAAQSLESPWAHWYARDDAGQPIGWKGHASLPVLDFSHPEVVEQMYAGPDAVLRHWLRPPWSIDGWRLDVIHMLGEGPGARGNARHVRGIRRAIREENPHAYVLGEHFFEATRWLQGDQEDGAMNYHGFTLPVRAWLAGQATTGAPVPLATTDVERWMTQARARLPVHNQRAQLNLLDSHDTPRLKTLLGGDTARLRLAMTLLFAWPGVPCLYYGDEIGLEGGPDPDCRRPFPWDRTAWDTSLLAHVRALAARRRERAEWRHGAVMTLAVTRHAWAFARVLGTAASVVVVNRGPAETLTLPLSRVPVDAPWRDADGASLPSRAPDGTVTIGVPDGGARVLLAG